MHDDEEPVGHIREQAAARLQRQDGQYSDQPRMDLADTLVFVNEAYTKMLLTDNPRIHRFAMQFGLQALCVHMGWTSYEVAAAEQYATLLTAGTASTVG